MLINLILIILIITILICNFWWAWGLFFIILLILLIVKSNSKIWLTLLIFPCVVFNNYYLNHKNNNLYHRANIVMVKTNYLIVKEKSYKYKINYFNHHLYKAYQIIDYQGLYLPIHNSKKSTSNFNAKLYFLSLGVKYELTPIKIYIKSYFPNFINKRIDKINHYHKNRLVLKWFSNLFIMLNHDKNLIYTSSLSGGYVNLLTVSGFHIAFIYFLITNLLRYLTFKKIKKKHLCASAIIVIWWYISLVNFPISATRAIAFLTFNFINNYYLKRKFNNIDILAIVGILFLYKNFYNIFSLSYILSFYCTFIVIIIINISNLYFAKISKLNLTIIISSVINIMIFPINIYLDQHINFSSIFNNIIMEPFIMVAYILVWLNFAFPIIGFITNWYLVILVKMIMFLNHLNLICNINSNIFNVTVVVFCSLAMLLLLWIVEFFIMKKWYN